ncbi:MAG: DNA-binding protein [Burkholderiales bacterium RIFCSPLOWO2_12_FULL_61_40]|nr:MAG: DNA-binding protein [Burkholderiales bacterium RIFCSPLOWO2_12_FULL_61_40]
MTKANRALASAKLLLDSGDVDGACNRSYYAMFDAARAALLSISAPVPAEIARTHSGLITAFSLHLVKPGLVAVEHGRSLNKVEDLRLIADYKGDPVTLENAAWALEQSEKFLAAVQALIAEP